MNPKPNIDRRFYRRKYNARKTHETFSAKIRDETVEVTGTSVDRIEGGKIVEGWVSWDRLGLLRQLGAVPKPDQD